MSLAGEIVAAYFTPDRLEAVAERGGLPVTDRVPVVWDVRDARADAEVTFTFPGFATFDAVALYDGATRVHADRYTQPVTFPPTSSWTHRFHLDSTLVTRTL